MRPWIPALAHLLLACTVETGAVPASDTERGGIDGGPGQGRDPAGECSERCPRGTACIDDLCLRVLADRQRLTDMISTQQHLIWSTRGTEDALENVGSDGAIMALAHGGDGPEEVAGGLLDPGRLAAIGRDVYWVEGAPGSVRIRHAAIGSGEVSTIVDGLHGARALAVDDDYLYWGEGDASLWRIEREPPRTALELATRQQRAGVLASDTIRDVVVVGEHVYWLDGFDLARVDRGGELHEHVAVASNSGAPLHVDDSGLYWTRHHSRGAVGVVALPMHDPAPGNVALNLAIDDGGLNAAGMTIDGAHVYWGRREGYDDPITLLRSDKRPGETIELLTTENLRMTRLAQHGDTLYLWGIADGDDAGPILALPKP